MANTLNKKQTAETDREHLTAYPIVQFDDRITNGFRWLAPLHLQRREGDRLPGRGLRPSRAARLRMSSMGGHQVTRRMLWR